MARKPSPGANLATIADSLGISVSTASRALRNADGIHPETRRLVLAKAGELGYILPGLQGPDINARPHQILALATEVAPGTDQAFLTGMSRASIAMNLAVLSHHVAPEEASAILDHERQPVAMRAGMVDGIILIHYWPPDVVARISERFPTVSIVHRYPTIAMDTVGVDDRVAAETLVRHLVAGGHRKIGFFGFCDAISWSRSRFAAFVEALVGESMPYEPRNVIPISLEQGLAHTEFDEGGWGPLVANRIRHGVDAWICPSANTSISLLAHAKRKGIKVPSGIAVANASQLPSIDSPITSMDCSNEAIGGAALRRLVHRLQSPGEISRSIMLPPRFQMGATTRKERRR